MIAIHEQHTSGNKKKGSWAGVAIGVVVTIVIIAVFYIPEYLDEREQERILAEGRAATGEIIRLEDTGNRSNHDPEVQVWVEYTTEDGRRMTSYFTRYLSAVEVMNYQPGTGVTIKYDPQQPGKIALVSLSR